MGRVVLILVPQKIAVKWNEPRVALSQNKHGADHSADAPGPPAKEACVSTFLEQRSRSFSKRRILFALDVPLHARLYGIEGMR